MSIENQSTTPVTGNTTAQPKAQRRRKPGPRWLRKLFKRLNFRQNFFKILLAVIAVVAMLVVVTLVLLTDATDRIEGSINNLTRVITNVSNRSGSDLTLEDFTRLQVSIDDLLSALSSSQQRIALLRPFVGLNASWKANLDTLDMAQQLALAASTMLDGLQPSLLFLGGGQADSVIVGQISSGERLVELLQQGRGKFIDAQAYLERASNMFTSIETSGLSINDLLNLETLTNYQNQLVSINEILLASPSLLTAALGLNEDQSYLILSQNNDEIRPSGGYISTYGWINVRNGRITDYDYSPTSATTPNSPPESLSETIALPSWWIRFSQPLRAAWDGSWEADFPATASMSMWYYNAGNNPQSPVSGVIAIDISAFEQILGALGQVELPEYDVTVTRSNFREVVYTIRGSGEGDVPHKRFLAALYRQIFSDWQTNVTNSQTSAQILGVLLQAVQQKHVMFYFADEQLQNAVSLLGWSGQQQPATANDYLMVVDTNLGNKSNNSVIRQLTYDVEVQTDGALNSRTTITYDYSDTVASLDPAVDPEHNGPLDYSNLIQVFTPIRTTLNATSDSVNRVTTVNEDINTLFVSRSFVPYDSSQRYQFSYTTDPIVQQVGSYFRYRLLLQKQPGMRSESVSIQITLPPDTSLVSANPEPSSSYRLENQVVEFRFDFTQDEWIEILYRND